MDPMGRPGSYGDLNAFPTNAASVGEWLDAIGLVRLWPSRPRCARGLPASFSGGCFRARGVSLLDLVAYDSGYVSVFASLNKASLTSL